MSAFAGIFFKLPDQQREQSTQRVRSAVLSHSEGRKLDERASENVVAWKLDFGAFGKSDRNPETSMGHMVIAGHPYVDAVPVDDRLRHVAWLCDVLSRAEIEKLSHARGSYAFAYSSAVRRELTIGTDCLGVRPLYYMEDAESVVFSTTLRTFESLSGFDARLDERGAIEEGTFGFCLADRTRYQAVKCAMPGQAIQFTATATKSHTYWQWGAESSQPTDEAHILQTVFASFQDAVRLRLAGDKRAMAFLTGGLDSRCVVAAVKQQGAEVNTLNFAPTASQDLVFGALLGKALNANHLELPMPLASVAGKVATVMPKWIAHNGAQGLIAARPRIVWSGDGGSVALGHVYLTDQMIDLMDAGDSDAALKVLLEHNMWKVARGVMPAGRATEFAQYPIEGMHKELRKISNRDPGRSLHVLLMVTDQRRHLHDHFERIYMHECELHLPFFDRDFLLCVLSYPVRPFVAHRFYNKWLQLFSEQVRVVPWQAYPGHEQCLIPVPEGLSYQWDADQHAGSKAVAERRAMAATTIKSIVRREYDHRLVDAARLALVSVLTYLGIKDYRYALQFAKSLKRKVLGA